MNWRPAWSIEGVPGQPGLYSETMSQNKETKPNKQNKSASQKMRKPGLGGFESVELGGEGGAEPVGGPCWAVWMGLERQSGAM